eukprot:4283955-Prymnesium_polylepis.1
MVRGAARNALWYVFVWTTSCRKRLGNGHVALTVLTPRLARSGRGYIAFLEHACWMSGSPEAR